MEKEDALEIICMIADGLNPYMEEDPVNNPPEVNPATIRALCKALTLLLDETDKREIRSKYRQRHHFEIVELVDGPLKKHRKMSEKGLMLKTLAEVDYDISKAAQLLKISISTFEKRISEYQLEDTIFANRYLADIVELDLPLEKKLDQIEAQFLSEALCAAEYNKNEAAELLGITFRSFRYKIDKHNKNITEQPKTTYLKNIGDNSIEDILGIIEYESIKKALELEDYNKTEAAARLGITFRSLRYKLDKLDIMK